jgi:TPR repeat protein
MAADRTQSLSHFGLMFKGLTRLWRRPAEEPADTMARAKAFADAGDFESALQIWGPLAQAGHPRAQNNVGGCFLLGRGVKVDHALAHRWLTLAADAGDVLGQRNLAGLYFQGLGVARDYETAARWYRAAATRLGTILYNALGCPRDVEGAVRWWREAAAAGDGDGAAMLGAAYHLGHGLAPDQSEAFHYLSVATDRGSALTAKFLPSVRAQLSPEAIETAERRLVVERAKAPRAVEQAAA